MNKLIKIAIEKRRVVLFLTCVILVFGSLAYYLLPRQESPDVSAPIAMIITPYPGASPKDVKDLVTTKIEDELSEIEGIDYIKSDSKNSVSIVLVWFENYVDTDKTMTEVRQKIDDIQNELPNGCFKSKIKTNLTETAGIIIALSGENYTYEELASFAEQFKSELSEIKGISRFDINGELEKQVSVDVNLEKINQMGLSLEDIYKILKVQNIAIPSGKLENYGEVKINVNTPGIFNSLDDIKNTIIGVSKENGTVARLSDVADVHMEYEDGVEKFKENGKNAVLLTGYFQQGKNIVIVGKDVRKTLDKVKANLPENLIVDEVLYQPEDVSQSINSFMTNLLEGIICVVIIVFIGMGMRNAMIVSAAIPISIFITFGVMYINGIKIHQMSTAALIIALGMLVDNAIVISDAVQVRVDNGQERLSASYEGASASAIPIFASTLTTVVAFSPLLGIPGPAGEFLQAIPQVVIISLVAAYIVSMFITPSMTAIFFKKSKNAGKEKKSRLRNLFEKCLSIGLKNKAITVIVMFALLICTVNIMKLLDSQFFPYADKDIIYIDVESEVAANIDATEKLSKEVEELLSKEPEVVRYTTSIGNGLPKFYISLAPPVPSDENAQIMVKVDLKKGERFRSNEEFASYLQNIFDTKVAGGKITAKLLESAMPSDAPVILRITGDDSDRLIEVSKEIQREITKIPGAINIRDDSKDKSYELNVNIDTDVATNLGISKYDIQRQINIALKGAESSTYRRSGQEYKIIVQSDIQTKEELENLKIKSSITKNKIPLKQFGTINMNSKTDIIKTYNKKESVKILSDVDLGYNPSKIENYIEYNIIPKIDLEGVKLEFDGQREAIIDNFGSVSKLAGIAVFVIYIILLIQFNSFIQPFVILATIPLSLIGSVWGLFIFRQPLSMTAFLGIVSLIGLVVKNAILLIEFINDARKKGYTIEDACKDAVNKRFSPIMLGAITTIIGLIPLAFSGSSLFAPMSVSLMSGLVVSTFLTMVVIPVIYTLIEENILKFKNEKMKEGNL
ncbi:MAG: efflux RND transporter permease subunit [Tepidibacter sp.]|jgi:multidrug efflux pump subunit AcrB|uniref:efflux RND transporter permease subunit n=1 Tax=Tepidibacter sp. TaxID=2529387 RepID=UPI0025EFC57B|nr:efflux RND transporter permease subunit [Tepidibacter sp.]MCT4508053.1 efflux RND transporter permease subunit [Tepidibacter sp.]